MFSVVFTGVAIINMVPALLPPVTRMEVGVVAVLHAGFIFRIVRARLAASKQRAVELESFKAMQSREHAAG